MVCRAWALQIAWVGTAYVTGMRAAARSGMGTPGWARRDGHARMGTPDGANPAWRRARPRGCADAVVASLSQADWACT